MPELPDLTVYLESLERRILERELRAVRLLNPFVLRTAVPPVSAAEGRKVIGLRRIGKRLVLALEGDLFLVLHLMIAGRLHWLEGKSKGRNVLARFEFDHGALAFTEAGTKRRASLHVVLGEESLRQMDPGGAELDALDEQGFASLLRKENHTLKRALTDPRLFAGIGNAYADEILHRARLSPIALTSQLEDEEVRTLYRAIRETMDFWVKALRDEAKGGFPEKVTAFREGMAVHGRYGKPCPDCGAPVQRIVYAENETNYCARCQTGGRILADRALSRLLRKSWPRSIDER